MYLIYPFPHSPQVSDKSQVRSVGAVVATTRQPVKGRKKHGGIRLGEMERDALLSHGAAFCLHDRLMKSSDAHVAYCCSQCGGMLGVRAADPHSGHHSGRSFTKFSKGNHYGKYNQAMGVAVRGLQVGYTWVDGVRG